MEFYADCNKIKIYSFLFYSSFDFSSKPIPKKIIQKGFFPVPPKKKKKTTNKDVNLINNKKKAQKKERKINKKKKKIKIK